MTAGETAQASSPPPQVAVTIVTDPSDATVRLDGELLCTTPCDERIPRSDASAEIAINRRGFRRIEREIRQALVHPQESSRELVRGHEANFVQVCKQV